MIGLDKNLEKETGERDRQTETDRERDRQAEGQRETDRESDIYEKQKKERKSEQLKRNKCEIWCWNRHHPPQIVMITSHQTSRWNH